MMSTPRNDGFESSGSRVFFPQKLLGGKLQKETKTKRRRRRKKNKTKTKMEKKN